MLRENGSIILLHQDYASSAGYLCKKDKHTLGFEISYLSDWALMEGLDHQLNPNS